MPKEEQYSGKDARIDELEDQRFDSLCTQVSELHKLICGNGAPGIIRQVTSNKTKIKILITIVGIILTALITTGVKNSSDMGQLKELVSAKTVLEKIVE